MTIGKAVLAIAAALCLGAEAAPEPISMTADGFSSAPTKWRIESDGSITSTAPTQSFVPGLPFTLVTRRTGPMPDRYRQIVTLLKPARAWAKRGLLCTQYATDGSVGNVRWGDTAVLGYYSSCREIEASAVVRQLFAASALIGGWVASAPIVETREVSTREQLAAIREEMAK